MKVEIILTGKTTDSWLKEGIELYIARLKHYISVSVTYLPASTSKMREKIVAEESDAIRSRLLSRDHVIVLDERGKEFRSVELAAQMEKWMLMGSSRLVFIVGGAYGVDQELKQKAHLIMSFSKMTFTHQMIRLMLVEQLYRAMSIIKNESYHHE